MQTSNTGEQHTMNRRRLLQSIAAIPALFRPWREDAELRDRAVALVEAEAMSKGVCGVAISVLRGDTELIEAGFGHSDLEKRTRITPDTWFNIASLTKPFTAAGVMRLVESDRVRLDAAVSSYLQWVPGRYKAVTVRQLLTHTSGVNRDLRNENADDFDEAEFRRRLETRPASFDPGTKWQYSNTGYSLLSFLIEAVSGKPYGDYLQEVLAPAGVAAGYRLAAPKEPNRAVGYQATASGPERAAYYSGGFGGGGLVTSVREVTRWCRGLGSGRVLKAASLKEMWQQARLADGRAVEFAFAGEAGSSYGFGWFISKFKGSRLLTHGGAVEGFSSNLYYFPDQSVIVGVLSNTKGRPDGRPHVEILAQELSSLALSSLS